MNRRPAALLLAVLLAATACVHRRKPAPPPPPIRYVLEHAWQGEVWFYPHESFSLDETGLATVLPSNHAPLTADNEPYDAAAPAAAMQAVQLPAVAILTNLDNGREMLVRINDRGPPSPKRLIAVTPHVATWLGFGADPPRVRVRLDPQLSAALARQVQGSAADLALATAPRDTVQQANLAPLTNTAQEAPRALRGPTTIAQTAEPTPITAPIHLPDTVTAGPPTPGPLLIEAGSFGSDRPARTRAAQINDVNPRVVRSRTGGITTYAVEAGPYASPAEADAALDQIIRNGIIDARIVVDLP